MVDRCELNELANNNEKSVKEVVRKDAVKAEAGANVVEGVRLED